jgi:hypothetical protein
VFVLRRSSSIAIHARRMVAGLLPATDVTIDTGVDELAGNGRAQQTMIDPQAGASMPGARRRHETEERTR